MGELVDGHLGLSADEVLTTTRAVRKRLDFDRPVPRELITECVEIAHQSPSGSSGGWTISPNSTPNRSTLNGAILMSQYSYAPSDRIISSRLLSRASLSKFARGPKSSMVASSKTPSWSNT